VAQSGLYVAALLPDDKGLGLIDPLGAPLRIVARADRRVVGVLGDPTGRRLVTIEQVLDESISFAMDAMPGPGAFPPRWELNLWDPEHLERPITLPWSKRGPSAARPGGAPPRAMYSFPMAAISPDGKTVAVAPVPGTRVKLFSAADGSPLKRDEIETQTELSALALGPSDLLATAGNTAGGVALKLWDLDTPAALPTSLTPPAQNFTRLMRFSPQGTLLAIAGIGPIELWDPVAHSLVGVLRISDQAADLAFAQDGRVLAAVGRAGGTSVWTVHDSAARVQLSGFNSRPSSLAFSEDGVLAGGGWNGDVWCWRTGRCPEIGSPQPTAPASSTGRSSPEGERAEAQSREAEHKGRRDHADAQSREGERRGRRDQGMGRDWRMNRASVAFDFQGRLIAHDAQGLRVWAAGSVSPQTPPILQIPLEVPMLRPFSRGPMIASMAKTPDGRIMALARPSGVSLWRPETPKRLVSVVPPPGYRAEAAPAVVSGSRRAPPGPTDAPALRLRAAAIAPRGDRLYWIEGPGGLPHVWELETTPEESHAPARELSWPGPLPEGGFHNLALRGDGALLALADRTGTVTLFDTHKLRMLGQIKPPAGEPEAFALALTFSPDGRDLAIGSQQGTIGLWSLLEPTRPKLRFHLPAHRGTITNLVFDPLGQRLASSAGVDPLVEVWDLALIGRELDRLGLAD
jgi:WD40 repeat protein